MSRFKSGITFYRKLRQIEATYSRKEREEWLKNIEGKHGLWADLCENVPLDDQFIRRYRNYVDWFKVSFYQSPSDQLLLDFYQYFDWSALSRNRKIIERVETLRLFKKFDWDQISKWKSLSIDFLREFKDKLNWQAITGNSSFSEDMMNEFRDKVDWKKLASDHYLSNDFIRKHRDRFDWERISYFQDLNEEFVEEMEDYIVWNWFNPTKSTYSKYSKEFKKKHEKQMSKYLEEIKRNESF